jgi:hypothetical protein
MTDILKTHFPEDTGMSDVLGGIPDFTHGEAVTYFAALTPEDREIVQWYATRHIRPAWVGDEYVFDLAKQYPLVDPMRESKAGIETTLAEFKRVSRYVSLFINATDFFPCVSSFGSLIKDEDSGEFEDVSVDGWDYYAPYRTVLTRQEQGANQLRLIDEVCKFIVDPKSTMIINQERVLREFRLRIEWEKSHPYEDPDS